MFEKSLVPPTYRRLHVVLRPTRIATAIPGDGWQTSATRMIENYSRKWGGVGDIMFPVDTDLQVAPIWIKILRAFDADRMATYQSTHRGRHMANPEAFEEWIAREAKKLADDTNESVEQMRQQLFADHIYRHPISTWRPAESLQSLINHWMGPFAFRDHLFRDVFQADASTRHPEGCTDISDLTLEPGELCVVRVEGLPDDVQLLIDARLGAVAPSYRDHLGERGWAITTVDAGPESLVALLEIAWLGRPYGNWAIQAAMASAEGEDYEPPAISRQDLPERAPFEVGKVGCGVYNQFTARWEDRPIYVIYGDSGDDFCLAMALERGWDAGIWLPPSLVGGEDADLTIRTLADVLHRTTRGPGVDRRIMLTSATQNEEELEALRQRLVDSIWGDELADLIGVIDLSEITLPTPRQILDSAFLSEARYEPFVSENMAAELAPPLVPSAARSLDPYHCRWQVEVSVVGHSVPSRTDLAETVLQGDPWTTARAGKSGLVFPSHRMGFIPAGATLEQVLERPRPRIPDAAEIFETLLARRQLVPTLSDKGKFAAAMIGRWGGLEAALGSLGDDPVYAILHAYAEPEMSSLPGISLGGRRFMTIYNMSQLTGLEERDLVSRVDDLVERQVLRRGYALKCGRCDFAAWYGLGELDQVFVCGRCAQRQVVAGPTWREPAEQPNVYFDLDEVVYQTLTHDGAVTLLALGAIKQETQDFLYTPEMEIVEQGEDKPYCEVDIWSVVNGDVIVGEAKRGNRLQDAQAQKLARIAEAVSADVVVLATAASQWRESAVNAMGNHLSGLPTRLELLTDVAPPRPWETEDAQPNPT